MTIRYLIDTDWVIDQGNYGEMWGERGSRWSLTLAILERGGRSHDRLR